MTTPGLPGMHRTRHRHHHPAKFAGPGCGVQGSRTLRCLDDEAPQAEGGDQPVPSQEARPGRADAWRHLGHDQLGVCHLIEESDVASRIGLVQATSVDTDGASAAGQCTAVCCGVDAVGAPRHHGETELFGRQTACHLCRHGHSVVGGGSGTDDSDCVAQPRSQPGFAQHPKPERLSAHAAHRFAVSQVGEGMRPLLIGRDDISQVQALRLCHDLGLVRSHCSPSPG